MASINERGPKCKRAIPNRGRHLIEVALRPGVTDTAARELEQGASALGISGFEAATATRYELSGELSTHDLRRLAEGLFCNDTIERYSLGPIRPPFWQQQRRPRPRRAHPPGWP